MDPGLVSADMGEPAMVDMGETRWGELERVGWCEPAEPGGELERGGEMGRTGDPGDRFRSA